MYVTASIIVSFGALTLLVECQEEHPAHKNLVPFTAKCSLLQQVEDKAEPNWRDWCGKRLI